MCDYSLQNVSLAARQKLATDSPRATSAPVRAAFARRRRPAWPSAFCRERNCPSPARSPAKQPGLFPWRTRLINHKTAIFRQINMHKLAAHHDALEFPDGRILLLTLLSEGQQATVLQLPAQPKTAIEAAAQERVAYTG